VSDTELHATLPALAAGTYPVHLDDVEEIDRTLASLIVVESPTASWAAALSYPTTNRKQVTALIYDAQRQAILVGLQSISFGSQVVRFARGADRWESPTAVDAGRYPALALSTNGDALLSSAGTSILELDPVTLATRATISTEGTWDHLTGFGVSNDGQALATSTSAPNADDFTPLYREFVSSRTLEVLGLSFQWGQIGASADGARVFMGTTGSSNDVYLYDASTGLLTGTGVSQDLTGLSVDRTGAKLIAAKAVFNRDLFQIGSLPATTAAAVIAPDGKRAYTYDQNKTLRVFDLTQNPVDGIFPELGSGTTLSFPPDNKPAAASMAITPDGGTVILAGSLRVVVQPVP
jgi:WD40 repeat protein